jgi:hypothetical protein
MPSNMSTCSGILATCTDTQFSHHRFALFRALAAVGRTWSSACREVGVVEGVAAMAHLVLKPPGVFSVARD